MKFLKSTPKQAFALAFNLYGHLEDRDPTIFFELMRAQGMSVAFRKDARHRFALNIANPTGHYNLDLAQLRYWHGESSIGASFENPRSEVFVCLFNRCREPNLLCTQTCMYDYSLFTPACTKDIIRRLGCLRTFDVMHCDIPWRDYFSGSNAVGPDKSGTLRCTYMLEVDTEPNYPACRALSERFCGVPTG